MFNLLSVFVGGGLGSVLRSFISGKIGSHWGIMTVNLLGAMFIGLAVEYFAHKVNMRPEIRGFVITGLLGGFTTFSTYMLDFGNLVGNARHTEAFLYLLGSLVMGVAFLFLGLKIGKVVF